MNYKIFIFFLLIISCATPVKKVEDKIKPQKVFSNKGFALLYNDDINKNNFITKKIEERSLTIFQKNLKENTIVKITNLLNNKYLIATVGPKSNYPIFYNSVLSKRIFDELEIDPKQPYIQITTVGNEGTFIAKKAKTFEEEKNVADKAPVEDITIKDLSKKKKKADKKIAKNKFSFIIKVADFYFKKSAESMFNRIKNETTVNKLKIMKISKNQYRVYSGPFKNLKSLKKAFNDISIINFENLEIIKQ